MPVVEFILVSPVVRDSPDSDVEQYSRQELITLAAALFAEVLFAEVLGTEVRS